MVREAIFNLLGSTVAEAQVLDLFAGSGALGIDALSRGAASALFIDENAEAIMAVRRNLEAMGAEGRGRAERGDVAHWLRAHPESVAEASLVILDPPYNDPVLDHVLILLDGMVAAGATVVAEHAHRQALPPLDRLRIVRERRYGDSAVTVYERR
jgi:16S rRNA (guanine(966)-N(2))-methyltransferase RsmD